VAKVTDLWLDYRHIGVLAEANRQRPVLDPETVSIESDVPASEKSRHERKPATMHRTHQFLTRRALIALLGIFMLPLGGAAWAQNAQGTIVGRVTDPSGAAVVGPIR